MEEEIRLSTDIAWGVQAPRRPTWVHIPGCLRLLWTSLPLIMSLSMLLSSPCTVLWLMAWSHRDSHDLPGLLPAALATGFQLCTTVDRQISCLHGKEANSALLALKTWLGCNRYYSFFSITLLVMQATWTNSSIKGLNAFCSSPESIELPVLPTAGPLVTDSHVMQFPDRNAWTIDYNLGSLPLTTLLQNKLRGRNPSYFHFRLQRGCSKLKGTLK